MTIKDLLKESFKGLFYHKLRSFLAVSGIVVGVMTVIVIQSAVAGYNRKIENEFTAFGSDLIILEKWPWVQRGFHLRQRRPDITLEDAKAINEQCKTCKLTTVSSGTFTTISHEDMDFSSYIEAGDENFLEVYSMAISNGRFFNSTEVKTRANVAVLGNQIANELFPNIDPIGKKISIGKFKYYIIGVLESKGSIMGESQDNFVCIPITTFFKDFGSNRSLSIGILPVKKELFYQTKDEVKRIMRQRHNLGDNKPDDFAINSPDDLLEMYYKLTSTAFLVMILIGGIALIVGAIGVMNIMLVSVTERTNEIGLRKAIGANSNDILNQFLSEAIFLCVIGGISGIILGIIISKIIQWTTPIPSHTSISAIILSVLVMVFTGLISGLIPALKASKQNPIDALRYE